MATQGFGRRSASDDRKPTASVRESVASGGERTAGASFGIVAAVGGLVMLVALGGVFVVSAATGSGSAAPAPPAPAALNECRGSVECVNEYSVALRCGSSEDARTVTVVARDSDAAERKAERYNRDCRSGSVLFLQSLAKSAAVNAVRAARAEVPTGKIASERSVARSGSRVRFRLRRR